MEDLRFSEYLELADQSKKIDEDETVYDPIPWDRFRKNSSNARTGDAIFYGAVVGEHELNVTSKRNWTKGQKSEGSQLRRRL